MKLRLEYLGFTNFCDHKLFFNAYLIHSIEVYGTCVAAVVVISFHIATFWIRIYLSVFSPKIEHVEFLSDSFSLKIKAQQNT